MAINFDTLPQDKPKGNKVIPGIYKYEIIKAEMREPYGGEGPDYLQLNLKLTDMTSNKVVGFINDKIVEGPKPAVAYKIQRLIRSIDLGISGTMELSDIAKVIVGAKGFVDVTEFTPEGKEPIAIVNLFEHECYYKKSERAIVEAIIGTDKKEKKTIEDVVEEEELPFDVEETEDDDY